MFDKKDKAKFYAELFRNLGTALIAGAYISASGSENIVLNLIIALSGVVTVLAGTLIMEM